MKELTQQLVVKDLPSSDSDRLDGKDWNDDDKLKAMLLVFVVLMVVEPMKKEKDETIHDDD